MKLGLEAGKSTHDLAIELGVYGVPISAGELVKSGPAETLRPLKERGLNVCQVGAFGFNPLAINADQQKTLEAAIPLVTETGCPYTVINGGNYHPSGFGHFDRRNFSTAALEEVARVLEPVLTLAERHGVKIAIEPYLKTAIYSAQRFLDLHQLIPSPALVANLDPSSLYDFWDMMDPAPMVKRTCRLLAGHYGLVHIKEVGMREGFHLNAGLVSLGEGVTDWSTVLKYAAAQMPNDAWIILEHVASADEARKSLDILRAAANKAGIALN